MNNRFSAKSFTLLGVLIAMEIVLSRFLSIHTWNVKISLSFIPIVIAAMLLGALEAGLVAAIGDILGAFMFPVGPYFPGFTATAFITGVIFALFLKKKQSIVRILFAVLLVQIIGCLMMNTYFISVLYGAPFKALFVTRIYQAVVMAAVQVTVTWVMSRNLLPVLKKTIDVDGFYMKEVK